MPILPVGHSGFLFCHSEPRAKNPCFFDRADTIVAKMRNYRAARRGQTDLIAPPSIRISDPVI